MALGIAITGTVVSIVFIIWAIHDYTPRSH